MKRFILLLILAFMLFTPLCSTYAQDPDGAPPEPIDDLTPPPPSGGKVDDSDTLRIPESYRAATGGPDRYGYTYVDSDGSAACRYRWITPAGAALDLEGDDAVTTMAIGFPFPFYGNSYTRLTVDSNGALLLADGPSAWANRPLGQDEVTPRIAPFWDDLQVEAIQTHVEGIAPQRTLVVTFQAHRSEGMLQFQALLSEEGGIAFHYRRLAGPLAAGDSATVGIQGPTAGLGYLFNGYPQENRLHSGLAVCFLPPEGIYLSPGGQQGYAQSGAWATYRLTAINRSGAAGTFDFSVDSPWPAAVRPQQAFLPAGAAAELAVAIDVPQGRTGEVVRSTVTMSSPDVESAPASSWLETVRVSGAYGYTGASTSDEAAIFDLQTWLLIDRLSLLPEGDYPYDATMTADWNEVWIPGASGDGVVVIDTTSNEITHRILVGEYPTSVAFRQDGAYAFVANRDSEDITVVDTASYSVVDTIPVPTYYLGAGNLALDPCGGAMYVVDWYGDYLFQFDPQTFTVTQELLLGDSLWQLVANPLGGRLYVTDRGSDVVHVVDTATFSPITTIPVGDDPWGIDITSDGALIYVANEDSHNVTVIDATDNSVITTIALPHADAAPRDVDFSADGAYAYVTSGAVSGDDEVYVINTATHTVVGQINVAPAGNPNVVAVAPQMDRCVELFAEKEATPEPVVIGDPLSYAIAYTYTGLVSTTAAVTDSLPAGVAYLTSTGGLSSSYDIIAHQVIWDLGTVGPGQEEVLTALVLPVSLTQAGQTITNQAALDFGSFSDTVWATSTLVPPTLSIRYPDGGTPPDPLLTCAEEGPISLTAASNRAGPLLYAWNLGDGTVADTQTISHSWAFGSYVVAVTTTNPYGWIETDTLGLEVGHAPQAGFLSNSPVTIGENARFTDTTTYEPTTWLWDFGDGAGSSDQPNPAYNYSNPGTYTVTLTVTNRCGVDLHQEPFVVQPEGAGYAIYLPLVWKQGP